LACRGVRAAHPIQVRTGDEVRALADGAIDAIVAALVRCSSVGSDAVSR
jgi:hypothetical protein